MAMCKVVNSAPATVPTEASTPKVVSLSEQLDDALAEQFWIREYIELIEDGYQYAHKSIHYYDGKLRLHFWPNIGWGVQPIAPETRQGYRIERKRVADTLLNRRAQWKAALEEIKPVTERIHQLRRLMATEEKAVGQTMAQNDGGNGDQVSEEEDSKDVVSDGQVCERDVKEEEEGEPVTRDAATDKRVGRAQI